MDTPVIMRESFPLYFAGSQIFSMELDGLREHCDIVMDKFARDLRFLMRPSAPSLTGIHLRETIVTTEMIKTMLEGLCAPKMHLQKAALVGLNASAKRAWEKGLRMLTPPARFVCAFFLMTMKRPRNGW